MGTLETMLIFLFVCDRTGVNYHEMVIKSNYLTLKLVNFRLNIVLETAWIAVM